MLTSRTEETVIPNIPKKIWNEDRDDYQVRKLAQLPFGYRTGKICPKCGSASLSGALICFENGELVISSTDEDDPNIVCLGCGYWADAFP